MELPERVAVLGLKAQGRERAYNRRFLQMCSHYLVEPLPARRRRAERKAKSKTRSAGARAVLHAAAARQELRGTERLAAGSMRRLCSGSSGPALPHRSRRRDLGVTPAGAASASRSAKGYALCEDGARENGLHRNGHQAQPVRSMSHSVQGSCEHRRTEPAARRQRELPHRESAPRVIEAAGRILRIRHATSSVGFHSLSCFVAALVRADTSGIPPTGERCAVWVAPVPQCGGISLLARYTSRLHSCRQQPSSRTTPVAGNCLVRRGGREPATETHAEANRIRRPRSSIRHCIAPSAGIAPLKLAAVISCIRPARARGSATCDSVLDASER